MVCDVLDCYVFISLIKNKYSEPFFSKHMTTSAVQLMPTDLQTNIPIKNIKNIEVSSFLNFHGPFK